MTELDPDRRRDRIDRAREYLEGVFDSLGVEEDEEGLVCPVQIRRRRKDGSLKEIAAVLRRPSFAQRARARLDSRKIATEHFKLDLERDADFVGELENFSLLCFALRDPEPPHVQHRGSVLELLSEYDVESLSEAWGLLDRWTTYLHPSFGEFDAEDLWEIIVALGRSQDIRPLLATPGHVQATCMLFMAARACESPSAPLWLQPPSTSPPDSSTAPPSSESSPE